LESIPKEVKPFGEKREIKEKLCDYRFGEPFLKTRQQVLEKRGSKREGNKLTPYHERRQIQTTIPGGGGGGTGSGRKDQ